MAYEKFIAQVMQMHDVFDQMCCHPCPKCSSPLAWVDGCIDEEYMPDGSFERTERFYCDNCNTFADVTQVYRPSERHISIKRDVFNDDGTDYTVETIMEV